LTHVGQRLGLEVVETSGLLEVYPVSARVNNPRNQAVEVTEPLHPAI
jgi:hypothetical protein